MSKQQFFLDIENDNVAAVEKAINEAADKATFLQQKYDGMTPVLYAICMMRYGKSNSENQCTVKISVQWSQYTVIVSVL